MPSACWPRWASSEITVDYIVVDTLRVPRATFAAIFEAWRDGYAEAIGELTPISRESATAYFNQMIVNIRDPRGLRGMDGPGGERQGACLITLPAAASPPSNRGR